MTPDEFRFRDTRGQPVVTLADLLRLEFFRRQAADIMAGLDQLRPVLKLNRCTADQQAVFSGLLERCRWLSAISDAEIAARPADTPGDDRAALDRLRDILIDLRRGNHSRALRRAEDLYEDQLALAETTEAPSSPPPPGTPATDQGA